MKLLWVFPSFEIGGAQRRFLTLAGEWGGRAEHVVAAMDARHDAEALAPSGASIRFLEIAPQKSRVVSLMNVAAFQAALRETAPDLLITVNWGAIEWRLANRRVGIAHLHCEDGFGPDEARRRSLRRDLARRVLFSRLSTGHDRYGFVAPSRGIEALFRNAWGVSARRLRYIPNGVDPAAFANAAAPQNEVPVIGAVGALRPEKRFDRLLRVFTKVRRSREARLLIVGDGPERRVLESLAGELEIASRVEFAGAQADVAPFLSRMDVYALTSDTEQAPISLVEAMAAGRAIAGANVGDVSAMVEPENRPFLHAPTDEESMAVSIVTLLHNDALRAKLGAANAARAAAEFSAASMAQRYWSAIEDICR